MTTIENPPAGVCRLTGRILTATGKPRTGATLTLTPIPALPAYKTDDADVLVAAAKISVNKNGMITSVDPATGQVNPWVDVLTGDWDTCLRVTGAGEPWSLTTRLPAGQVTDISDLRGVIVIPPGSEAEQTLKEVQATIKGLEQDMRSLNVITGKAMRTDDLYPGFRLAGPAQGLDEIMVDSQGYVSYENQVTYTREGLEMIAGWVNELHNETAPALNDAIGALGKRVETIESKPAAIRSTGWIKLTGLPAGLIAGGSDNGIWLNRVGDSIYMAIRGANNKTPVVGFTVPAGYRHAVAARAAGQLIPGDNPVIAGKVQFINGGTFEWKGVASAELGYGVFAYPTSDPWPEA